MHGNNVSTNRKLHQPLGKWINQPIQLWSWYTHADHSVIYRKASTGSWTEYPPVSSRDPTTQETRQTKGWYDLTAGIPSTLEASMLIPTTI
jgi:hypothetical protein